jgi:hypothetical protein
MTTPQGEHMSTLRSEACLGTPRRTLYLLLGAGLTAFALVEMIRFGGATWIALAFIILPDIALMYGAAPGLERGRLHPRAVRFYNVVHSFWIPLAFMLAGLWLPPLVFTAGAVWAAHIAWDRGLGFGLRSREGYQRLPVCG